MIPIFDLDDTLYPERSFVESGFNAVASMLASKFGWEERQSKIHMMGTLRLKGRGSVFDELLRSRRAYTAKLVQLCVQTYRQHRPEISLYLAAQKFLKENQGRAMYLVTDGNKNVQANKIKALGLEPFFKHIFITHRFGIHHAKPSTYCFSLIREIEKCSWNDLAYIGDNPAKDFVNLNPLNVMTIRVKTGEHAEVKAKNGFDARVHINTIENLSSILNKAEI